MKYTVDGTNVKITPDYKNSPVIAFNVTNALTQFVGASVYQSTKTAVRLEHLFHINLEHENSVVLSSTDRVAIETSLQQAWTKSNNGRYELFNFNFIVNQD